MPGYKSKTYADSFSQLGEVFRLENSHAYVILRGIPDTPYRDVMGCYPLFCCEHWDKLAQDFDSLPADVVAFSLVTDPLGSFKPASLESTFPDLCKPFKTHYVLDLKQDSTQVFSKNHLRNAKKAAKSLQIERLDNPIQNLDIWTTLYGNLIKRHNIEGITRFSRYAFEQQLNTPGLHAYEALLDDRVAGMVLFYQMGQHVYYHLAAYTDAGYKHRASFGIFYKAIQDFQSQGLRYLNLGSGAGLTSTEDDGLVRFKKGWATETKTAWLCGKILQPDIYEILNNKGRAQIPNFFPAYRSKL